MDASKFLDYLKERFPQRRNMKIVNLKNITSGWETEIESFDLEWLSDDGKVSLQAMSCLIPGNCRSTHPSNTSVNVFLANSDH